MKRPQIITVLVGAVVIAILYSLPRVVVENEDEFTTVEEVDSKTDPLETSSDQEAIENPHSFEILPEERENIDRLTDKVESSASTENFLIFADSLARAYQNQAVFDSSAKYFELVAEKSPGIESNKNAGQAYFDAFSTEVDPEKAQQLASKARLFFEKVLDEKDDVSSKNKLAMTYIASENPMRGIVMLREILEESPNNEEAIFNLGVLSIQSGQYDKAIDRFENLIELNPSNLQAQIFLGVSYLETGKKNLAKEQFTKIKDQTDDPEVIAIAESYLKEIN
ncbi:MAG: tetratricopeptide repeat protein [Bacteroidota bacterium]